MDYKTFDREVKLMKLGIGSCDNAFFNFLIDLEDKFYIENLNSSYINDQGVRLENYKCRLGSDAIATFWCDKNSYIVHIDFFNLFIFSNRMLSDFSDCYREVYGSSLKFMKGDVKFMKDDVVLFLKNYVFNYLVKGYLKKCKVYGRM